MRLSRVRCSSYVPNLLDLGFNWDFVGLACPGAINVAAFIFLADVSSRA